MRVDNNITIEVLAIGLYKEISIAYYNLIVALISLLGYYNIYRGIN